MQTTIWKNGPKTANRLSIYKKNRKVVPIMVFGSIGALIDPNAGASPGRRKEGDEKLKENPQK